MRIGVVEAVGSRRRALSDAIAAHGDVAVRVEIASIRRERAPLRVGGVLDALLVASVALEALGSAFVGDLPWCLLDDGRPLTPPRFGRGFAGAVEAPGPAASSEEIVAVVAEALGLLARRCDLETASAIVASSAAGIVHAGPGGRVRFANAAYVRFLGGAPGDVVGRPLAELVQPSGDTVAIDGFQRALDGEGSWHGEVRLGGAPATTLFAASVATVDDGPSSARGIVVTLHDLSARRAVEDDLRSTCRLLERHAWTDLLTGLANRAFFDDALERELSRTRRHGTPTSVLLVDLDDFKRVNDGHGHDAGDELLAAVSGSLRLGLREADVLARYGGDEFCVLLAGTDAATAWAVAERVRSSVGALRSGARGELHVTTSIGLATTADLEPGAGARALVRLADRAMYAAKQAGGDRVAQACGRPPGPALAAEPKVADASPPTVAASRPAKRRSSR